MRAVLTAALLALAFLGLALLGLALSGCAAGPGAAAAPTHLERARRAARSGSDADVLGRWLLAELLAPGGELARVRQARARLERARGAGAVASMARAIDHDVHGRAGEAARAYLDALEALRTSERVEAELHAWFAANRVAALRAAVPGLWKRAEPFVVDAMERPGRLGWRARLELVEWWGRQAMQAGARESALERVATEQGCVGEALMAGPFGTGSPNDVRVHFAAERPAPWPARFTPDPATEGKSPAGIGARRAEVLEVERRGCNLRPRRSVPARGVYYLQTFLDLPAERDVVVAASGAHALFVDDRQVLDRDPSHWGVWPRFGVRLRMGAGRHRILARLGSRQAALRVVALDGMPAAVGASAEQGAPYGLSPVRQLGDPNALAPFLRRVGVALGDRGDRAHFDVDEPFARFVASYLAHVEGQDDVANVLLEPLVADERRATPLALAQRAVYVDGDPIFTRDMAVAEAGRLRELATRADPDLWGPRLWLALRKAEQSEPTQVVGEIEEIARRFPELGVVQKQLATLYARLEWTPEHARAVALAAERFPEDADLVKALLEVAERRGDHALADALAARVRALDPAEEVDFRRALARADYGGAVRELQRIAELHEERRDIAMRIADLLGRAGRTRETLAKLELAVEKDPQEAAARLALADARYAGGERGALHAALVEAVRHGADAQPLRDAIELVDGVTSLEPYRRDGLATIRAVEKSGVTLPGTAARLLDYAVLWIAHDGSARMLEHELVRIQSREGIAQHAEQAVPNGVVLRLRTIKQDGRTLEPELVAGKPTVTMPHLEVGDYVETESIWALPGDGEGGRRFRAPRWLFREPNVSYHTSELVVIAPRERPLAIETAGEVPEPTVEEQADWVVRRWRVEGSLALPEEPLSAPIEEFLPSVQVGWGIDLDAQLRVLADQTGEHPPLDPRLRRLAWRHATGKLGATEADARAESADAKARRLYRWVLDNVQPGQERWAPRVVHAKSGDRLMAFVYLCRLAGVDARIGLVRDRLAPPPRGPFSAAGTFGAAAVRVATEREARWVQLRDRFAPYGWLPSSLSGQPALVIEPRVPRTDEAPPIVERDVTPAEGTGDRLVSEGTLALRDDGGAAADLTQSYQGRYAMMLRRELAKVPPARRNEALESWLLSAMLPGALIRSVEVGRLDDLDQPVTVRVRADLPSFAQRAGEELVVRAPFLPRLAVLVPLAARETPLYLSEPLLLRMPGRARVALRVKLPDGAAVVGMLEGAALEEPMLRLGVGDRVARGELTLEREIDLRAGRVQPHEYARFRELVQSADERLNRPVRVRVSDKRLAP